MRLRHYCSRSDCVRYRALASAAIDIVPRAARSSEPRATRRRNNGATGTIPGRCSINYIGSRVLQAFVTLILFMVILFVATRAAGDPAMLILPADATPEQIQAVRERIGTDRSYIEQFAIFARDMATLNLGRSIVYREPVVDLIGGRIVASLKLQLVSLILILATAFPLGVL